MEELVSCKKAVAKVIPGAPNVWLSFQRLENIHPFSRIFYLQYFDLSSINHFFIPFFLLVCCFPFQNSAVTVAVIYVLVFLQLFFSITLGLICCRIFGLSISQATEMSFVQSVFHSFLARSRLHAS